MASAKAALKMSFFDLSVEAFFAWMQCKMCHFIVLSNYYLVDKYFTFRSTS